MDLLLNKTWITLVSIENAFKSRTWNSSNHNKNGSSMWIAYVNKRKREWLICIFFLYYFISYIFYRKHFSLSICEWCSVLCFELWWFKSIRIQGNKSTMTQTRVQDYDGKWKTSNTNFYFNSPCSLVWLTSIYYHILPPAKDSIKVDSFIYFDVFLKICSQRRCVR